MEQIVVAALYQFTSLPDFAQYQKPLQAACDANDIMGTILLASEGINGTIAGSGIGIDTVLDHIRTNIPNCSALDYKKSFAAERPFYRMKVRLKREIVTMGVAGVDPNVIVGDYVDPADWNRLITDPDVVVIDTRNDYEVAIGTFKGAIDPRTKSFREFPEWVRANADKVQGKKIAMFCTGGIRCEKASSFMKNEGFETVYHLKGGILKYLESIPPEDSLWQGECFVFDQRTSVGHGLVVGDYDLCHACRHAITAEDKQSPLYIAGIACPNCHASQTPHQKQRFTERQKQIELARRRGEGHIGQNNSPGNRKTSAGRAKAKERTNERNAGGR